MAVEKDFELLDDFLSNRLNESDKMAFEKKLEADPELKQELNIQRDLMEGIRKARVAELKSILNNVPVPPVGQPTSLLIKAGTLTIVTGLVITGLYFYFAGDNAEQITSEPAKVTQPTNNTSTPEAESAKQTSPEVINEKRAEKLKESAKPKVENPVTVTTTPAKPDLKVYDPSKEAEQETPDEVRKYEQEQLELISKAFVTSSIEVEAINADKRYKFHYVFKEGKLVLYGAFEKNLYEILEFINDDKRTVVLFYQANYYLLDINKSNPTLLTPIRDKALLKKLSQYRGH